MSKHPLIVENQGSIIDHIGIGVPDFDTALMDMEKQLGVRPLDLGTFGAQRRAAGWLAGGGFLEVLGPATADIASLDPMMRLAAVLPAPAVMFWYVAVGDFDAYVDHAARVGHPLDGHQHIQSSGYEYRIAGPNGIAHVPVVPWIIQWIARAPAMADWPQLGKLTSFHLEHPDPSMMEDILSALGVPAAAKKGVTPRALLTIEGEAGRLEVDAASRPPAT